MMSEPKYIRMNVVKLNNGTWHATVLEVLNQTYFNNATSNPTAYDNEGALYYVVVVVFIYGLSIILMIGSQALRKKSDGGIAKYMEGMDRIRMVERRHAKFKTRVAMMQNKQISAILGRRYSDNSGETRLAMIRKKEQLVSLARSSSDRSYSGKTKEPLVSLVRCSSDRSYDKSPNKQSYKSIDPVLLNMNRPDLSTHLSPLKSRGNAGNAECVCLHSYPSNSQGSPRSPGKFLPAITKTTADASTSPDLPMDIVTVNKDKHIRTDNVVIFDFPTDNMSTANCTAVKQVCDKMIHIPMDTLPEEDEELVPIYV